MNNQSELQNNPNTNTNKRALNLILVDESGSMGSIYAETLDGMNRTINNIKSQADKVEGVKQYINLITFDSDHYTQHLRHCPAQKARTLTREDYRPCACTPLYDAIGRAVTTLERHVTDNDAVLVTIITDGLENASHEFSGNEIRRLIQRLSSKGWLFTFIGANQDVIYEAEKIGIKQSLYFEADSAGTNIMWEKERGARAKYMSRMNAGIKMKKPMRQIMDEEQDLCFFDN